MKITTRIYTILMSIFLLISCNREDHQVQPPSIKPDDSTITLINDVKIFAHRGFYRTAGSAENSIASLTRTYENKIHGVEMDLRMSKD